MTMASETRVLTSSQVYIEKLQGAFGYKSKKEIYRLIKEIPNIDVHTEFNGALTSHSVIISFGTTGDGQLKVPFPPETKSITLCSGEWNKVQVRQLEFELRRPHKTSSEDTGILRDHPYGVFDFPLAVSGKPFGLECHVSNLEPICG